MKDLANLYYFEKLLEDVNNDLVRQAQAKGDIAIGAVCFQIPEPLINLPGSFSVRLRAPRTGSIEMGTYYMSSMLCEGCRAILERAIEGGFNFLDCIIAPDACAQMNRCVENIERQHLIEKEKFFVEYSDVPMKNDETALRHFVKQMRRHVLEPLNNTYGIDISDDALRKSVELQNKISRLIRSIGDYRKEDTPRITGYEFHILNLVTYTCPKYLILPYLKETLAELKKRKPDEKLPRARVGIVGSEIDDPEFTKMIEAAGARVVFDRHCFGSIPGREVIELSNDEDALPQIVRHYMNTSECARYIADNKVKQRRETADRLAKEFKADGIIYEQMKYCDFWGFERALVSHIMSEEYGWPVLSIDRLYNAKGSGQLRTRFQAFVESLEIKKIQKGGKK